MASPHTCLSNRHQMWVHHWGKCPLKSYRNEKYKPSYAAGGYKCSVVVFPTTWQPRSFSLSLFHSEEDVHRL